MSFPRNMTLAFFAVLAPACSNSNFSGSGHEKTQSSSKDVDKDSVPGVNDTVTVPVGGEAPVLSNSKLGVESCTSDDDSIAEVDEKTCVVTGVSAGTANVKVTLKDGTVTTVAVTVTEASSTPLVTTDSATMTKTPQFGLLVNNLECSFCHVKINGDVVSTSDVGSLWNGSSGIVNGAWTVAGAFNVSQPGTITDKNGTQLPIGQSISIDVSGGVKEQTQTAATMPKDLNGDGKPDFPVLDFSTLSSKMKGSLSANGVNVQNVYNGNLVVVGTTAAPFQVSGEVLVKGDLVIKGPYKGIGNIYVTGNIYIPGDILAKTSPFPYSTDRATALTQAKAALAANMDALALATPKSIIISDFETHPLMPDKTPNGSVFEHPATPEEDQIDRLGVRGIYSWFAGGQAAYEALFDTFDLHCMNNPSRGENHRSFSRIDALLYAGKAIGGRANLNSYSLNGGVIANYFHVISGAVNCPAGIHPVHKQDQQYSYVNYDWRMQVGLLLLKQFGGNFN